MYVLYLCSTFSDLKCIVDLGILFSLLSAIMEKLEYYKVGFVRNAATEAQSSFFWVTPIRELCSNSNTQVKDVEVFEERVNQIFSNSSSGGFPEKLNYCPGDIVCVQHHNKWVRGEIISATRQETGGDESQIFNIFLVDHALAVRRPLERCKSIPENVLIPKVSHTRYKLVIRHSDNLQ